jgi:hypothetical protein
MSDILAVDFIRALWDDARREVDPDRKAQLERDAAALEDVWTRSPYALAPTRDQMTAALGNASLNIADTLSALASGQRQVDARVGEIHTAVQENNMLFSTFFDTFPPQFAVFQQEMRSAIEENARGLKKLEHGQQAYNVRLDEVDTRHGGQWEEAMTLYRVLADRLDKKRAELDQIQRDLAAMQAWRDAQERGG